MTEFRDDSIAGRVLKAYSVGGLHLDASRLPGAAPVQIARVYMGTYFSDLTGRPVPIAELAKRLRVPQTKLRNNLKRNKRVRKTGTIIDEDIRTFIEALPEPLATSDEYRAHREVMGRRWGNSCAGGA